jgi:hypothetical protein
VNKQTCQNFQVNGFPRLYLIHLIVKPEGNLEAKVAKYAGHREVDAMLAYIYASPDVAERAKHDAELQKAREKAEAAQAKRLSDHEEKLAERRNGKHRVKILTASNFDAFYAGADVTDDSALLVYLHGDPAVAYTDLRESTLPLLADTLHDEGRTGVVVGTLNCMAHQHLCHKDQRFAMPKPLKQLPQLVRFQRSNMKGKIPGELYQGTVNEQKLLHFFTDKGFSDKVLARKQRQDAHELSQDDLDEL